MSRRLTSEERRLWGRIARTVRAAPGKRVETVDDEPTVAQKGGAKVKSSTTKTPASAAPRRPGPPDDLSGQRRIRRGQSKIDGRIDLHGHTQDTAHRELFEFILRQASLGARCALVITGKGRLQTGILRARLFDWIADPDLRPFIAGYAPAHPRHGGAGAVYIFLRSAANR